MYVCIIFFIHEWALGLAIVNNAAVIVLVHIYFLMIALIFSDK